MKTPGLLQASRKSRIDRFAQRQSRTREWVNFADIADFCARDSGSILPDEEKRTAAFMTLAKDVLNGEFDNSGRSQVLFLNYSTKKARLTHEDLTDIIEHNLDGDRGLSEYLPYCWARREFIERWFEKHRLQKPPGWFKPQDDGTAQIEVIEQSGAPKLQSKTLIDTPGKQDLETARAKAHYEMSSAGGKRSGIARREKRAWAQHASELAIEAHTREPSLSNERIAAKISDNWKLENPNCPGSRTLSKFISELRKSGSLPQRSGSLQKRSG
jgi:hypothetical protein